MSDTGIGIPAGKLAEVFEPFAQVESALDRAQGGLGIGLTIVRRLVELHGGTVSAHSGGPGRGSTFTVRLPAVAEFGMRNAESKTEGSAAGSGLQSAFRNPNSAFRRRVLVVDDNADAADSLALLVQAMGHEARTARDGPQALAAAAEFRPELVLLDVGMPGMSGHEVAARLRGMPEARGAAIAAVTGWGQEEDRRRTREAGFDHHFVKPIEPRELEELLAGVGR